MASNSYTLRDPMKLERRPFPEVMASLMAQREWNTRDLERALRARWGGWGSIFSVSVWLRGEMVPSMQAMERIARVFNVKPETFAEYRLAKRREELNPAVVGLGKALKNLGEH